MFVVDLILHGITAVGSKKITRSQNGSSGLPHFEAVQNNFSYNAEKGVTRGCTPSRGRNTYRLPMAEVFGAWVDLRKGTVLARSLQWRLLQIKPSSCREV